MRSNAEPSVFWLTAANPPVSSASVRRLSCDSLMSFRRPCCAFCDPNTPIATFGRTRSRELDELGRQADEAARIEREEVDVRSCRRGDGIANGAADVGRRVEAVDLAHRHFEALAEQQHGLPAAPDAGEELAEVAERVEHRERTLLALEIEHADGRCRIGDAGARIDFVFLSIEPGELAVVVLLEGFDRRRLQAAADELVDGGEQQIADRS